MAISEGGIWLLHYRSVLPTVAVKSSYIYLKPFLLQFLVRCITDMFLSVTLCWESNFWWCRCTGLRSLCRSTSRSVSRTSVCTRCLSWCWSCLPWSASPWAAPCCFEPHALCTNPWWGVCWLPTCDTSTLHPRGKCWPTSPGTSATLTNKCPGPSTGLAW